MTRKPNAHGSWQYICHLSGHGNSQTYWKFQKPITPIRYRRLFANLWYYNSSSCEFQTRASVLVHTNVHVLRPGLPAARLPNYTQTSSFHSKSQQFLALKHHVPRYASPALRDAETGTHPNAVPYGIISATVAREDESRITAKSELKELLPEDSVPRSDPARISQLYNQLFRHAASGRVEEVLEAVRILVTEERETPNLKLYHALVLVNISMSTGSAAAVAAVLEEMESEGISPDINIYHDALKALAIHPDCVLRGIILSEMRRRWFTLTESGWHDVVAGYAREGLIEQALENLDNMQNARVRIQGWLYDMIIYTLCDLGEVDEATKIMKSRVAAGDNSISAGSWFYLFDQACVDLHYDAMRFIWRRRVESQFLNPTSGQCFQVLTGAARHGDVQTATDVFRVLSKRATAFESQHYELLIEAYIKVNDLKTALTILCLMNSADLALTQSATSSVLSYLKRDPDRPREAFEILRDMKADRQVPTGAMNRIIEACVDQENGLAQAVQMYSSLHSICAAGPNVGTFNALLVGCRKANQKDTAMFLVSEMLALKIRPDIITYDRLILMCLQETDYEDAVRYYDEMRNAGLIPRSGTLVWLIRRCCDAGDERAWKLLEDMRRFGMDDSTSRVYLIERFRNHSESPPKDMASML